MALEMEDVLPRSPRRPQGVGYSVSGRRTWWPWWPWRRVCSAWDCSPPPHPDTPGSPLCHPGQAHKPPPGAQASSLSPSPTSPTRQRPQSGHRAPHASVRTGGGCIARGPGIPGPGSRAVPQAFCTPPPRSRRGQAHRFLPRHPHPSSVFCLFAKYFTGVTVSDYEAALGLTASPGSPG